jgi:hypothetical protein
MGHYLAATASLRGQKSEMVEAHNGYNHARKYSDGTIVQWHPDRPQMGTQYLYSGEPLKHYNGFELMVSHVKGGGRLRRLDITVDTNSPINIYKCKKLADAGKWKSRCRSAPRYLREKGETLYAGAKTSDEMLRIYDKRAEQGLDTSHPVWVRIELKMLDDKAENAGRVIARDGLGIIPSLIKGYADFPTHAAWKLAFDNVEGVVLPNGEKKISDVKGWLLTQVAGSLVKTCEIDSEFLSDFLTLVCHDLAERKAAKNGREDLTIERTITIEL